jgi:hypothetical protein
MLLAYQTIAKILPLTVFIIAIAGCGQSSETVVNSCLHWAADKYPRNPAMQRAYIDECIDRNYQ